MSINNCLKELQRMLNQEVQGLKGNPEFRDRLPSSLTLLVKFGDDHIHGIYPDDEDGRAMILTGIDHYNVNQVVEKTDSKIDLPDRIVFHNRQAIGDILMFTIAVRDFKKAFPNVKIKVESTASHLWDYNPNICREEWHDVTDPMQWWDKEKGKPSEYQMAELTKCAIEIAKKEKSAVKIYIGGGKGTNTSNRSDLHFANAFRLSIQNLLGIEFPQGPIRSDLYMTQEEYNASPLIKPPYWLITAGEKGDWTCKTFPFAKWQEVIDKLPNIKFVQLGVTGHKHPDLTGSNVMNYIGKTQGREDGIRKLMNLFLNCEGSMGLVSFQMHLAAAFNKPNVVIAGAREPVWFTRYPGQRYLSTDGCLPCTINKKEEPVACWYCKIERCPYKSKYENQEVPLCADLITSDDIVNAVKSYYDGGRLNWNKPSGKSKLINVVKASQIPSPVETKPAENLWGFSWGKGSVTDKDWGFLKSVIEKFNIKTVLEFGTGLSTLLFNDLGLKVITHETSDGWIRKIKDINPECDIRKWDGTSIKEKIGKFDLVFVDGPAGGQTREFSTKIASEHSKLVIIHDAGREWERKWQDKYLKGKFYLASKGGHRCHFWKEGAKPTIAIDSNKKLLRMVFNGRGEGGAESSTTWIANRFIEKGWQVQYIHPGELPSGTFRKKGNANIFTTNNLDDIKEPCDILFLYTNDWVWRFKNPILQNKFRNVKAKRKVMAVNYRLGEIGKIEWTKNWNKYLFLNSSLKQALLKNHPEANIKVLPPPIDLTKFFENEIDYSGNLKLIRHSSQGDAKYPKNFNDIIRRILNENPDIEIYLMPAPSFLEDFGDKVKVFKRNQPPVNEFLTLGNCFWYKLPEGYHDQGPKVIMEAMSSGLPVIADNHSGAKDRVIKGTGFLCNSLEDYLKAMKSLSLEHSMNTPEEERAIMGAKAKEYAKKEFIPEKWIEEIIGV